MAEALRVLIADDEPIACMDLREMLEALGHVVVGEATCGKTALDLARKLHPQIALLDIRMPEIDGLEVARILATERICPTLVVSAYSDQEYIERSKQTGCMYYLVKPIRPSDLGPAIAMTMALSDRMQSLQEELEAVQEALVTRKIVERAKGVLMDKHNIKELEAFRRLQIESMNSRRSVREVAEEVLKRESR